MADTREGALKNLQKAGIPGPGRKKMTEAEKEAAQAKRMGLLNRMREYIESGDAEADFEKLREKMVDKALSMSLDRVVGPVKQSVEHSGALIVRVKNTVKEDINSDD